MTPAWERFQKYFLRHEALGFSIDISRMRFADDFLPKMEPLAQKAAAAMQALETGTMCVASFEPRSTVRPGDDVELAIDTRRVHLFDPVTGDALA